MAHASGDPIATGFAKSLNAPGGHITGIVLLAVDLVEKQVEFLGDLLQSGARMGMLVQSNFQPEQFLAHARTAANKIGQKLAVAYIRTDSDFDAAVAALQEQGAQALVVPAVPLLGSRFEQLASVIMR